MSDLYVVDFSGGEDDRARREAERRAERARLRDRYLTHLVERTKIDEQTATRVLAVLFDHTRPDGRECHCGCHPRLDSLHGDGLDCSCMWDEARRESERRERAAQWAAWRDSPESMELRRRHIEEEEEAITAWLNGQVDVEARRTSVCVPEQWEGTVDGHSFYFRERDGVWRIELDLEPNGHVAQRYVGTAADGSSITESVELTSGDVIAEGVEGVLGAPPAEHLEFIVRTVRDHLGRRACEHAGALVFCASCGTRM